MKWKHLPIVAFDTETTGLEPFRGDRIIELAVVVLRLDDEGAIVGREDWSTLVNPERDIPRQVTDITGISSADVADQPRFVDVADKVRELLSSGVTVAHNYPFDLGFLTREFDDVRERTGDPRMRWPEPLAEVDTVDLSMRCFREAKGHRLADLAERVSVQLERAHRATDDAAACGQAFVELVRRHRVADDLQAMLDWANAIGRPPDEGPIGPDDQGRIVFLDGMHQGEPVSMHPIHLGWIEHARERVGGRWRWRFSDPVRRWARRWLEVRGAGRARGGQKGFHATDWVLDPCIAAPRARAGGDRHASPRDSGGVTSPGFGAGEGPAALRSPSSSRGGPPSTGSPPPSPRAAQGSLRPEAPGSASS
jgi:DNA polymerase III subunit epsilon